MLDIVSNKTLVSKEDLKSILSPLKKCNTEGNATVNILLFLYLKLFISFSLKFFMCDNILSLFKIEK